MQGFGKRVAIVEFMDGPLPAEVVIEVEQGGERKAMRADKLLVCIGRRANLTGLGLGLHTL